MANKDLIEYYRNRAYEYEKVYLKPERQKDLKSSAAILREIFIDKNIIEIACGTGYWTEIIAQTAASIFAIDINEEVIKIAKQKNFLKAKVTFALADIFSYDGIDKYENLFGGFIWSHIPIQDLDGFLRSVYNFVTPGGKIVFIDNNFVEGSSHSITETDEYGNTFQARKLENGDNYLVLKNFPSRDFLREKLKPIATDIKVISLEYFWILTFKKGVR